MSATDPSQRDAALAQVRQEYESRTARWNNRDAGRTALDSQLLERTLTSYGAMLERNGLRPLGERRVLDVGSGRNEFLAACHERWGHTGPLLCGVELMPDRVEGGRQEYPYLTLVCGSADRLEFADASFDLVHQGMLLTSILDEALRRAIVAEMMRVVRPGGYILWYDFVWNPTNRHARGIGYRALCNYFPGWKVADRRRVTVVPPLARLVSRVSPALVGALERCRVLNLWEMALLEKPR
ncbi:MAG: class I SAM-dependent methyltransferase [Pirellulales bacterium]|nr:class I SAM-dependent methyltransferase [Pirellulales bacterium]